MNRSTRRIVLLASLVLLTVSVFLYTRLRPAESRATGTRTVAKFAATPSAEPQNTSATTAPRSYPSGPVDWAAFNNRFHLTQVDTFKLKSALGGVVFDFLERRGAIAQVERSEGDFFTIILPELPLTEAEVEEQLLKIATRVLGEQKAVEVLSDPEGFSALARYTSLAEMHVPRQFAFRRITPEGLKDMSNPLGYARFEIAISVYDAERRSMVLRINHHGFTYPEASSIGLGWNAMAKAPAGYFRTEPILGVASKPQPIPVVIREEGSNTYEVLNERGPGLSETVTLPKRP